MAVGGRLKKVFSVLAALAVVAVIVNPPGASAATVATVAFRHYALWPPNFCAGGEGLATQVSAGSSSVQFAAKNYSLKAIGPACDDPSPATANTFSALSYIEVYSSAAGWSRCGSVYYAQNPANTSFVSAPGSELNCGKNRTYRLRTEWRITYGGTNQTDADSSTWFWPA